MTTLNFVILLVVLVIIGGLVIKICFLNNKIFDYERSEAKLNGDIAKLENKLESAESKNKAYLKKEIEYEKIFISFSGCFDDCICVYRLCTCTRRRQF